AWKIDRIAAVGLKFGGFACIAVYGFDDGRKAVIGSDEHVRRAIQTLGFQCPHKAGKRIVGIAYPCDSTWAVDAVFALRRRKFTRAILGSVLRGIGVAGPEHEYE